MASWSPVCKITGAAKRNLTNDWTVFWCACSDSDSEVGWGFLKRAGFSQVPLLVKLLAYGRPPTRTACWARKHEKEPRQHCGYRRANTEVTHQGSKGSLRRAEDESTNEMERFRFEFRHPRRMAFSSNPGRCRGPREIDTGRLSMEDSTQKTPVMGLFTRETANSEADRQISGWSSLDTTFR
ncbi:unnamed protein product [Clonostachys rhizophaga]|uniref:Uncharacterized protein n=1 Tax=Clonostachys rhizophaga TaxID=160324 RepID=A0A9N9VDZ6_9HYPO|nr:unnamed protein product [Clonostachys rhizophaga]